MLRKLQQAEYAESGRLLEPNGFLEAVVRISAYSPRPEIAASLGPSPGSAFFPSGGLPVAGGGPSQSRGTDAKGAIRATGRGPLPFQPEAAMPHPTALPVKSATRCSVARSPVSSPLSSTRKRGEWFGGLRARSTPGGATPTQKKNPGAAWPK